uniref:Calcineurin-like phosphoesterase domain-containing protein n=1 Tax=Globisporangium ultimum (strain ATCC 200006 / CBS 805.95 / DAOM BR144) TaxID=431595 RepID=K3WUZ8_GLOUD
MAAPMERAHPNVALPKVLHQVAELPPSVRAVIVGDVHACYEELLELLHACAFDAASDTLVLVGDLVNKGPQPLEVVRFARETKALCVRGNHDDAALSAYYAWQANGCAPGSTGSYSYVEQFTPEDVQFLEQLPFTVTLPNQNAIVVHAGLVPGVPLSAQQPRHMYKMRYLHQVPADQETAAADEQEDGRSTAWVASETKLAELDGAQTQWATQWKGPLHVYFGHDAVPGLQQEAFATGLDTGCCYGRQLSACILPFLIVDTSKTKFTT